MRTLSQPLLQFSSPKITTAAAYQNAKLNPRERTQIGFHKHPKSLPLFSSLSPCQVIITKSLPLVASVALLLTACPAEAGFLSGMKGIESVPGPKLPELDFLKRINEENQKKYAETDAKFKSSPILKELLERSKQNKEKNEKAIQDKYCLRGAEWGVGDCSTEGMSPADREKFISELKQRAGVTE
ncbi:hypothetical protein Tsubulata_045833 [Turnera subulata]|uniref:Uncharacterized protein n=1 Tax=Turnera subulata TaxID=218843 RepID=A0A9Q0J531_9ROSI|nr:hypothetical protein Tsubulata_045833 [Turnera subulata]